MRTLILLSLIATAPALADDADESRPYVDNVQDNEVEDPEKLAAIAPVPYEPVPADIVAVYPSLEGMAWTGSVPSGDIPPRMEIMHPECIE